MIGLLTSPIVKLRLDPETIDAPLFNEILIPSLNIVPVDVILVKFMLPETMPFKAYVQVIVLVLKVIPIGSPICIRALVGIEFFTTKLTV